MILDNKVYGMLSQIYHYNKENDGINQTDMSALKHCLAIHHDMYIRYTQLKQQADLAERMGDGKWEDAVCQHIDTEFLHGNGPAPVKKKGV